MSKPRRSGARIVVVGSVLLLAWLYYLGLEGSGPRREVRVVPVAVAASAPWPDASVAEPEPAPPIEVVSADAPDAGSAAPLAFEAEWGTGLDQLGHTRPQEGNPEAPMSFYPMSDGRILVLDQVNGRIVRYGPDGRPIDAVAVSQQFPQDLAVAADGTTLVLDRLADRTVAVLGPDGHLVGDLPIEGRGLEEAGAVTGIFVDGEDVYLEREHGPLVRVGDIEGMPDPERKEIPGRPTRDGSTYLLAGIIDAAAGRLFVNAIERPSLQHRFTRELRVDAPVVSIELLDADRLGVIHLAVRVERPNAKGTSPRTRLRLICLAGSDGRPLGETELAATTTPEESFRDLAVLDTGGVLQAVRTETGVAYQRYECR